MVNIERFDVSASIKLAYVDDACGGEDVSCILVKDHVYELILHSKSSSSIYRKVLQTYFLVELNEENWKYAKVNFQTPSSAESYAYYPLQIGSLSDVLLKPHYYSKGLLWEFKWQLNTSIKFTLTPKVTMMENNSIKFKIWTISQQSMSGYLVNSTSKFSVLCSCIKISIMEDCEFKKILDSRRRRLDRCIQDYSQHIEAFYSLFKKLSSTLDSQEQEKCESNWDHNYESRASENLNTSNSTELNDGKSMDQSMHHALTFSKSFSNNNESIENYLVLMNSSIGNFQNERILTSNVKLKTFTYSKNICKLLRKLKFAFNPQTNNVTDSSGATIEKDHPVIEFHYEKIVQSKNTLDEEISHLNLVASFKTITENDDLNTFFEDIQSLGISREDLHEIELSVSFTPESRSSKVSSVDSDSDDRS